MANGHDPASNSPDRGRSRGPQSAAVERRQITDEAEWLKWREQDVTAHDVGALFGCHDFETAAGLYWAKRGMKLPRPDSSVLRRGQWLEPAFPRALRDVRPGWTIVKAEHYYRDGAARIGATPDFFVEGDARGFGVLQAKTTEADVFDRYWTETTPPPWIALQVATEMMLTGFSWGVIACLVLGYRRCELQLYEVPRHAAAELKIREAVAAFWRNVEEGIEPQLDYSRDGALLGIIYPREQPGKIVDLRGDNRLPYLLNRREQLTIAIAEAETERKQLDAEIKDKLGDAECAIVDGWRVTLKAQERKAHQVKESSFRVLRAKRELCAREESGGATTAA